MRIIIRVKIIAAGEGAGSAACVGSTGAASGASFFISFAVSLASEAFSIISCTLISYFNVLFWQNYSVGITYWNITIPGIVLIGSISILIIEKGISLTLLG